MVSNWIKSIQMPIEICFVELHACEVYEMLLIFSSIYLLKLWQMQLITAIMWQATKKKRRTFFPIRPSFDKRQTQQIKAPIFWSRLQCVWNFMGFACSIWTSLQKLYCGVNATLANYRKLFEKDTFYVHYYGDAIKNYFTIHIHINLKHFAIKTHSI